MSAWQLVRYSHLVVSDGARCPYLRLGLEHGTAFGKLHHCGHVVLLSQRRSEWFQGPLLKVGGCGLARTVLLMVVRVGDLLSHRICSLQEDQGDLGSHQVVPAAYLGPQLSLFLVGLYLLEYLAQERLWNLALHHEDFLASVIRLEIAGKPKVSHLVVEKPEVPQSRSNLVDLDLPLATGDGMD